jgi:threonine dehydrogenase-like Zn-dependent dehydrogenase
MKAVVFHGAGDIRTETVSDPRIEQPTDCIIKVTRTALCGSDLHLYNGFNPAMKEGDILGHEFMGEVVEIGADVKKVEPGDRIIVPFAIADGSCAHCRQKETSLCETTNPGNDELIKLYGYPTAALYGYSDLYGGIPGGQAEYVRVLLPDANAFKVPHDLEDEQALFATDIFPTGYMAAENANIKKGETVAIWGAGPVGLFTLKCAQLLGADKVILIDRVPERLELAREQGAETINFEDENDVVQRIKELTHGDGPDACIDAVGLEAHGEGLQGIYDKAKQTLRLQTDRPSALREVIQAAKPGGTVSLPGVYAGFIDKFPMGVAFGKGLTLKMGQTHVHRYVGKLFELVQSGQIDPTFVITHRLALDDAPEAYKMFRDKTNHCIKVVFTPNGNERRTHPVFR